MEKPASSVSSKLTNNHMDDQSTSDSQTITNNHITNSTSDVIVVDDQSIKLNNHLSKLVNHSVSGVVSSGGGGGDANRKKDSEAGGVTTKGSSWSVQNNFINSKKAAAARDYNAKLKDLVVKEVRKPGKSRCLLYC